MKQHFAITLLGLAIGQLAVAAPQAVYQPSSSLTEVTNPPVVDAITFYNDGDFILDTFKAQDHNLSADDYVDVYPFTTEDTLYYTNASSGTMVGFTGFWFKTIPTSANGRVHSAADVINNGNIIGLDGEASPVLFSEPGSTAVEPVSSDSLPYASQLLIDATNVFNQGILGVGQYGLLQIVAKTFTNANGALAAGSVDTSDEGDLAEALDTTGVGFTVFGANPDYGYYVNPPFVYDLFWGVTNGATLDFTATGLELDPPDVSTTLIGVGIRENVEGLGDGTELLTEDEELPLNLDPEWATYLFTYTVGGFTNIYYNVVFVNTNFADSNLSADVRFAEGEPPPAPTTPASDLNGAADTVQFSVTTPDVITGDTVTNALYVIDTGAAAPSEALYTNAGTANKYASPDTFAITTTLPVEWEIGEVANGVYDPTLIYTPGEFVNSKVTYFASMYSAQIGRDPETLGGSFAGPLSDLSVSNVSGITGVFDDLGTVILPDPTNEGGRIEVTAGQADFANARMRAEGMVIFNVTNLTGSGMTGKDWGEANLAIGATNGSLAVSNLVPSSFQRVRGDVYAWSATWQNTFTNAFITNVYHYHVLVVDQNLRGKFQPTIRNLTLLGTNTIELSDNVSVIDQAVFETTNLVINGSVQLTGNAANFTPATAPELRSLFVETNGSLGVEDTLDLGYDTTKGPSGPAGRKYTIASVTNFGTITAATADVEANSLENDGEIITEDGSLLVEANEIGLGLALTNFNEIITAGNASLSANTIRATNSFIVTEAGALTLDAPDELTDMVAGTPGTNNVLNNFWTVTEGFVLSVKPATGDLFGTEITTFAASNSFVTHVWAGADEGASPDGFHNNVVIGHLILDGQTNSTMHFTGAGSDNGMYVDYLELDPTSASYNQYRQGLEIDPSLTIYFADSNVDPLKLEEAYPGRLVWVSSFAGPNSTLAVPYENSSNVCLMNAALATSLDISFFNGVPNFYNQPFVLNNPNDPADIYPCPGTETTERFFIFGSTAASSTNNAGDTQITFASTPGGNFTITPAIKGKAKPIPGETYTLTAAASNGWFFNDWTTNGITATDSSVFKFTVESNETVSVVANFEPKPFTLQKGIYNGLFFESNGVTASSSGFFTLTLTESGAFSGRLLMGPSTYHFSSRFETNGIVEGVTAKSGNRSLTLNLEVTNTTGEISGDVSDGSTWDAPLYGDLAPVTTKDALAGSYTMVLPWETGTNMNIVAGDSYGAIKINKAGVLSVAGKLSDNAGFSQAVPVSESGHWPFYTYAQLGKDVVLGWVQFSNGAPWGTNISWIKGAGAGRYYANGFANILDLWGSSNGASLDLAAPVIILSGGDLAEPLTNVVKLKNSETYAGTNITLKIDAATGTFSGHFVNTNTGRTEILSGAVLENTNSARGFFLGTNEAGAVLLESAPGGL